MYYEQIDEINRDIDRTGQAIITLGCSFTQGQGAVDDTLYEEYEWHYEKLGVPLKIKVKPDDYGPLLSKYPEITLTPDRNLNFTFMEYRNAFGSVLAKKYFEGSYACINLGMRGNGNRSQVKELYFHPELHWDRLKKIVVIYCPSGLERFDFVNDGWNSHHHWSCMWPHYHSQSGPRRILWEGYNKALWTEKFEIIEQIGHVQELMTWCKAHNASLIVTPAFDRRYNRDYFKKELFVTHERNMTGVLHNSIPILHEVVDNPEPGFFHQRHVHRELTALLDMFPWQNVFLPDGVYPTFADLAMGQEFPDWQERHFFTYNGEFSPQKWITSCAHPSAKAHDLFARKLFEHIVANNL